MRPSKTVTVPHVPLALLRTASQSATYGFSLKSTAKVHEVAMEKRQDEIRRQKLEDAEKFFGMKPREIKCAVSHDSGLEPLVRINAAWSLWRR
jgi:predicted nucleic acid-binding protein